jgi:hypothetical protein
MLAMKHSHWLCGVFGALTILLVVLGAGAWAIIPGVACAVTCGQMIWSMVRGAPPPAGHA